MTEYITKEQAIDEVWDAFTSHDDPDLGRVIEENIERLSPADVVEVVRCKDCGWAEFYETSESEDIYECNFWNGEHYGEHARVGGNDYCSYGSMR